MGAYSQKKETEAHQGLASVTIDHLSLWRKVVYYMLGAMLNALYLLGYVQDLVPLSFLLCRQRHEGLGNLRNLAKFYSWTVAGTEIQRRSNDC